MSRIGIAGSGSVISTRSSTACERELEELPAVGILSVGKTTLMSIYSLLICFFTLIVGHYGLSFKSVKSVAASCLISCSLGINPVHADMLSAAPTLNFPQFVDLLGKVGEVQSVTFPGLIPDRAIATLKDGSVVEVIEGFPKEDPRSPAGPTQAIALCQHSYKVVCKQDISDVMRKLKTPKVVEAKPMLSHASYPAASDLTREKVNYPTTLNGLNP